MSHSTRSHSPTKEPQSPSPLQSIKKSRRNPRANPTRNYLGDEEILQSLRHQGFDSARQNDSRELRTEKKIDYNEAHMANLASHRKSRSSKPVESCSLEAVDEIDHNMVLVIILLVALLAISVKLKSWYGA